LFSTVPFSVTAIFVDPLLAGVLGGIATTVIRPAYRTLTPRRLRRQAVRLAAQATFYEKGIRHTRGRTGMLLYVSLVERMAEVVLDTAVREAVEDLGEDWTRRIDAIDDALRQGGVATAEALAELGPLLHAALPRAEDDENELPDEVCAS
jgi:putative membrane protein